MTASCSFIPPYVLEALASSGDPHLEAHAAATLAVDEVLRRGRGRQTGSLLPGAEASDQPRLGPGGPGGPQRSVHDAGGTTTLPGRLVRGEGDPPTGDTAVGEAYDGLGDTWQLWSEAYGRNSLDGRGLPLVATVHYGRLYDNAFWDGTQMVFGDGDGVVFLGFTRSIDVIGHELAHGVTQYTSGLNYRGQSGALNESVSDVFGVLVKQHTRGQSADEADWLVGAELLAPDVNGVALRSMAAPGTAYDDPRLGRDPQPAHYDDYVVTTADNGGVHINSGIPNKAFHLVATTLGGYAWQRAGQIWFDTITGDIRADCDFPTFARLTLAAATTRYGARSPEADAVRGAWAAVGLAVDAVRDDVPSADASVPMTPPDLPDIPDHPDGPGAGSAEVSVRRTGGVAGVTRERTVALGHLPDADALAWRRLLADDRLHELARAAEERDRSRPDAFCYTVACTDPHVEVDLPEPAVPDEVRDLLERTLANGAKWP
jgi:hypothetical protein